jgi:hypothetical protein
MSVMRGRGMGEEGVQMMLMSIAEAAAMMNMEDMFLIGTLICRWFVVLLLV